MYYPIMLNLKGKIAIVVGGGRVALRKVKGLIKYGVRVQVISPSFEADFDAFKEKITLIHSVYDKKYLSGATLVVAATSSKATNQVIWQDCKAEHILCNVVDNSNLCDFIVPSSIKRGDLVIAVSTMGKSPSLAAKIRSELEESYDTTYADYVNLLGELRNLILEKCDDPIKRKQYLNELIELDINALEKRRGLYESCCRL